ncbi:MAG: condensation domain-containing protein, partial [Pseudomonadota bacterium]
MGYPEGVADILPLTSAQQGMLFHSAGENEMHGQYVAVISCMLNGPLDTERLNVAMEALVHARDALRAGFLWQGVKKPVQVVREKVSLPWTELDWTARTDVEQGLKDLTKLEQTRQFDLKSPPLMAVTLIKLSDTRWQLVWTVHHLISDGWSTGVAMRDLFDRYSGKQVAQDTPNFKSHLVWLRKQEKLTDTDFWTDQFDGLENPSLLPEADVSAVQTQTSISASLGQDLMQQVERVSGQLKITTNTVLSGAWALTLRRLLQQDDVVFGTTTAGRPPEIPNIANAIGAFVNTLPVRCRIDPFLPVEAFLQDLGRAEIERRKHEYAALAEVLNCAPFPAGTAMFDMLFVNEGVAQTKFDFDEIRISDLTSTQFSNYPLSFLVTPHSDLGVEVCFNPSRITDAAVRVILSDYERLLAAITQDPNCRIRDLLKPQRDIAPVMALPKAENLVTRFLRCAGDAPQSPALTDDAETLTYADVSLRARQIAFALRQAGARNGDVIPVALPRGADAIAAFLGVMMSGAAYVPLDLDYPADSIAQVLGTIEPKLIVT